LMRPDLAGHDDLAWTNEKSDEDRLVRHTLEAAIANPKSNPAALMHELEGRIDERLMRDIQRELHILPDGVDFALEFEGARKQLRETYMQREHSLLLDGKSLSELTEEERQRLKSMSNIKSSNEATKKH
jgi:DNA primase